MRMAPKSRVAGSRFSRSQSNSRTVSDSATHIALAILVKGGLSSLQARRLELQEMWDTSSYNPAKTLLFCLETEYDSRRQLKIIDAHSGCNPTLSPVAYNGVTQVKPYGSSRRQMVLHNASHIDGVMRDTSEAKTERWWRRKDIDDRSTKTHKSRAGFGEQAPLLPSHACLH